MPVSVADAGYGRSVSFRLALEERGWSYVMAVDPKEIARPADAEPYQPACGGWDRRRCPATARRPDRFQASGERRLCSRRSRGGRAARGTMTSRFAALQVRPSGREAFRAAQQQAGGRNRWDGVLPVRSLLVEQPEEADEPTGYWMTILPAHHPDRRPGAWGEDALADRARLPRFHFVVQTATTRSPRLGQPLTHWSVCELAAHPRKVQGRVTRPDARRYVACSSAANTFAAPPRPARPDGAPHLRHRGQPVADDRRKQRDPANGTGDTGVMTVDHEALRTSWNHTLGHLDAAQEHLTGLPDIDLSAVWEFLRHNELGLAFDCLVDLGDDLGLPLSF